MSRFSSSIDAPLPFPIKVVPSATGPVRIYEIPDGQKEAVLKQLDIFRPVPSLDDVMHQKVAPAFFPFFNIRAARATNRLMKGVIA